MRLDLDTPKTLAELRKVYNDKVVFITTTKCYPLINAIEFVGDYLGIMKKRAVPVKITKRVDRAIKKYKAGLIKIWEQHQKKIAEALKQKYLSKLSESIEKGTLIKGVLLKDGSEDAVQPEVDKMRERLKKLAPAAFLAVYLLGKQRGQILTNQEIDDELTQRDRENLLGKQDWNDEFIDKLSDDLYERYQEVLEEEYASDEQLLEAMKVAQAKESHRLPMFAAAVGSVLLANGMGQAIKDVQKIDEETGEPTGEPILDEDTGAPIGDIIEGGFWRTMHDNRVCEGCESNDGFWMTVDQYMEESGTNNCLTNCRCPELFEPADFPTDESLIWRGAPGIDKAVHSNTLEKASIDSVVNDTDRHPTQSQKESGNYKKGHVNLHGLDISIENPKGSTRSGVSKDGKKWSSTLAHHYGYIKGTEDKDGDQVDVFIGPNPDNQQVFVIDQIVPDTKSFDEHKVMLGFTNSQKAQEGYLANYGKGWGGLGGITQMDLSVFKDWVHSRDTKKPIASGIAKAEWSEELHPRDESGKFTTTATSGSGGTVRQSIKSSLEEDYHGNATWKPVEVDRPFNTATLKELAFDVQAATEMPGSGFKLVYNADKSSFYIMPFAREHSESFESGKVPGQIDKDWVRVSYTPSSGGVRDADRIEVHYWQRENEYESGTPYKTYSDAVTSIIANKEIDDNTTLAVNEPMLGYKHAAPLYDWRERTSKGVGFSGIRKDWSEDLHPRDESGKFTSGGSASKPSIDRETVSTPSSNKLKDFNAVKGYLRHGTKIIVSAEKSNLSPKQNEARSIGLKRILQNYSDNVVLQEDQWGGSTERSYVADVNEAELKELESLAFQQNELDQEAVVVVRNGEAELKFRNGSAQRGVIEDLSDVADAKDNYSKIGDIKYRINFK